MDVKTFPENRKMTSGLQILLHGGISLSDATSYDKLGIFHCTYQVATCQNFWMMMYFFPWRLLILLNSGDPDQMPQKHRIRHFILVFPVGHIPIYTSTVCINTGPHSAVGNMSDCRSRGPEFDPVLVPYFHGDWSWNIFYSHSPPFCWFKKGCCQLQGKVCAPSTG